MKHSRIYSMLLACLTLGSAALASCGDADSGTSVVTDAVGGETTAAVTEIETTEEDARRAVSDNVPEFDFGGHRSVRSRRILLPMISGSRKRQATFSTMPSTPATEPLKNASTSRSPRCLLFRSVRSPRM